MLVFLFLFPLMFPLFNQILLSVVDDFNSHCETAVLLLYFTVKISHNHLTVCLNELLYLCKICFILGVPDGIQLIIDVSFIKNYLFVYVFLTFNRVSFLSFCPR